MKTFYIYFLLNLLCFSAWAQSSSNNYVCTKSMTNESGTAYLDDIQYYDGLGRPYLLHQKAITPTHSGLFILQEYDSQGRKSHTWLPYVNSATYVAPEAIKTAIVANYENDSKPYLRMVYEPSPLNRVVEQFGPGKAWHDAGKSVKTADLGNNTTYPCRWYHTTDIRNTVSISVIGANINYPSGSLYMTRLTDEDGNITYEFKNKLGQVVLTRQMNGSVAHETYYIYDSFGNLRVVLSPLASDALSSNGTWTESSTALQQYAYLYKYDDRNRCIAKKLPGAGWIKYVYDKADRVIFTQDGNQSNKPVKEWTFSIPDTYGRVVLTGTTTITPNVTTINNTVVAATYPESGSGPNLGYNVSGITLNASYTILSANYYDHYRFRSLTGFSNDALSYDTSEAAIYRTRYGTDTDPYHHNGLLTGTVTAQLGTSGVPLYLYSVMYYDNRARLIQTKSTNHLPNGIEKTYTAYNFTGQPVKSKHVHSATGKTTQAEEYSYTYDHAGRLLTTKHKLNANPEVILAQHTYDEQGRLKTKTPHANATNRLTYTYNIRNWLTDISGSRFTQNLYYNTGNGTAQWGGNISSMTWKAGMESTLRGYKLTYDGLSRLTTAAYGEGNAINLNTDRFSERVTLYDKHGNIQQLQRCGKTSSTAYGMIDNLTMRYSGNQLQYANDGVTAQTVGQTFHFIDRSNSTGNEYTYDANGNMNKDPNKNIMGISYNLLNLPQKVDFSTNRSINYLYDVSGNKLQVKHQNGSTAATMDYCRNFIYENGTLSKILIGEGYITLSGTTTTYHYYLRDHLGNNRVVLNQIGTVEQTNHYYPFGGLFDQTNESLQKYKYNGKELDREFGLELYDYSARYMDGAIGRFTTPDRFAEKYYSLSPYQYAANNPINNIDVNGDSIWISTSDGNLLFEGGMLYSKNNDGSLNTYKGKLAKLDKSGEIKGYKGILGTTVKSLNKLTANSQFANSIVSTLQSSENNFTIRPNHKAFSSAPVDIGNGRVGGINNNAYAYQVMEQGKRLVTYAPFTAIGSGGVINWNPKDGMIGLAHELGHSFDANFGMLDSRRVEINGGDEEIREIRAVFYENRIRQELGMGLRESYSGPKLLDRNNNPIYYQSPYVSRIFRLNY